MVTMNPSDAKILLAVTGASGTVYAERLFYELTRQVPRVYLVATKTAKKVASHELAKTSPFLAALEGEVAAPLRDIVRVFDEEDFFAPIASGSSAPTAMVVLPCSMGTLGRMAAGLASNLIERSADVVLKQRRQLIVCPRETPLTSIHLRNMLTLSECGAVMAPPMPGFYHQPQNIDDLVNFVVGRVLELLNLPHELYRPWNSRMR